jgi:hypothetical protein
MMAAQLVGVILAFIGVGLAALIFWRFSNRRQHPYAGRPNFDRNRLHGHFSLSFLDIPPRSEFGWGGWH